MTSIVKSLTPACALRRRPRVLRRRSTLASCAHLSMDGSNGRADATGPVVVRSFNRRAASRELCSTPPMRPARAGSCSPGSGGDVARAPRACRPCETNPVVRGSARATPVGHDPDVRAVGHRDPEVSEQADHLNHLTTSRSIARAIARARSHEDFWVSLPLGLQSTASRRALRTVPHARRDPRCIVQIADKPHASCRTGQ
jgi:hypothetical protein